MQRILEANWQTLLTSALLRGQFLLSPDIAIGLGPQLQSVFNKDASFPDSQKLEQIPVRAYSDDEQVYEDLEQTTESVIAVFPLKGVMLKYGTWCTYGTLDIAGLIKVAAAKENVSAIVLDIDSGGGSINAIPPIIDAIEYAQSLGKPVIAHCDTACSAAYWSAAACDYIFSDNNLSSTFGSIGVMISFPDLREYYEKQGIKLHEIYATPSAEKNLAFRNALDGDYDLITKEMLDPVALQFQDAIKKYRSSKLAVDTPGILNGKTFSGTDSVNIGLADTIGTLSDAIKYASNMALAKEFVNNY